MSRSRLVGIVVMIAFVSLAHSGCINVSGTAYYEDANGDPQPFLFPLQIPVACSNANQWAVASGWVYGAAAFSIGVPFSPPGSCHFPAAWGKTCIENCTFDTVPGQNAYMVGRVLYK